MSRVRQSLIGQRFGRLLVVGLARIEGSQSRWLCICECGNSHEALATHLVRGLIRSCGCFQRAFHITHGRTRSGLNDRTYASWEKMVQRCTNPNNESWGNYGGRGITVCERWRKFENFLADMGERPSGTSIDRFPNKNGNYEPGNCRWATRQEQANNTRRNIVIEHAGRRQTLTQWAHEANIHPMSLQQRLKNGWVFSEAISVPVRKRLRSLRKRSP